MRGISKVIGKSEYTAHAGVCTWLNGAYLVNIIKQLPKSDGENLLLVENLYDVGKIEVAKVNMAVESDSVYPLVRGRDIAR